MTKEEIRIKVTENNKKIEQALYKFVLTDEIKKCLEENEELRKQCKHEFVNGLCSYCDLPEEFKDD